MERQHHPEQLKDSINHILAISDDVLQFKLQRSPLEEKESIKAIIQELTNYKESLQVKWDDAKMYRVHFDLYAKLFEKHKKTILAEPNKAGDLDDTWLRKNNIKLELGSNLGKSTGIFVPLSSVYIHSTLIYKEYFENSNYTKECAYVDQLMLYIYRIFNAFVWDQNENEQLKKNINHIARNNLRMVPRPNGLNMDIGKILDIIPGFISQIGGGNEMGEKMGQVFGDPSVKNLISETLSGVSEEMNKSNGDLSGMVQGVMSRFQDVNFSQQLKTTLNKHSQTLQNVHLNQNGNVNTKVETVTNDQSHSDFGHSDSSSPSKVVGTKAKEEVSEKSK